MHSFPETYKSSANAWMTTAFLEGLVGGVEQEHKERVQEDCPTERQLHCSCWEAQSLKHWSDPSSSQHHIYPTALWYGHHLHTEGIFQAWHAQHNYWHDRGQSSHHCQLGGKGNFNPGCAPYAPQCLEEGDSNNDFKLLEEWWLCTFGTADRSQHWTTCTCFRPLTRRLQPMEITTPFHPLSVASFRSQRCNRQINLDSVFLWLWSAVLVMLSTVFISFGYRHSSVMGPKLRDHEGGLLSGVYRSWLNHCSTVHGHYPSNLSKITRISSSSTFIVFGGNCSWRRFVQKLSLQTSVSTQRFFQAKTIHWWARMCVRKMICWFVSMRAPLLLSVLPTRCYFIKSRLCYYLRKEQDTSIKHRQNCRSNFEGTTAYVWIIIITCVRPVLSWYKV